MKAELFAELQRGVREAAAYRRGDRTAGLKVSRFASLPKRIKPADIRKMRDTLCLSQPLFARYLGASVASVRGWEQGSRKPRSMALRLLHIVKKNPGVLLDARVSR
jgi:putative transcriptional regulator